MTCLNRVGAMNKNPIQRSIRAVSVVVLLAALAACSSPPVPTDTFYNLTTGRSAPGASAAVGGTVEVPRFRAEGVVNGRAIIYRSSSTEQHQYNYHYWAEPPAVMVQRSFIDALRNARVFDTVASPEMRADRDYELIGTLRRLEHITGVGAPKVVVEIDVALRRVRGGETLLIKTYTKERSSGSSVSSAVESISAALDQIIAEVVRDSAAAS